MALAPVPNTAQLTITMLYDGQIVQNSLYFRKVEGWNNTTLEALVDSAIAQWVTTVGDKSVTELTLIAVTATDLTDLDSARITKNVDPPVAGTMPGGGLPGNSSFAIKLDSGTRGRGRQGRVFHNGLSEENVVQSTLLPAYAEAIRDGWAGYAGAIENDGDCVNVVVHRQRNGVQLNPGETSEIVSYSYTDLFIDSQKNRLPAHRKHKRQT